MTVGAPTRPGEGLLVEATAPAFAWLTLAAATVAIAATVPFNVLAASRAVRAVVAAARPSLYTMYVATLWALSAVELVRVPAETAAAVIAPAAATVTDRDAAAPATWMANAAADAAVVMATTTSCVEIEASWSKDWASTAMHHTSIQWSPLRIPICTSITAQGATVTAMWSVKIRYVPRDSFLGKAPQLHSGWNPGLAAEAGIFWNCAWVICASHQYTNNDLFRK